jgi:hypothetical protein
VWSSGCGVLSFLWSAQTVRKKKGDERFLFPRNKKYPDNKMLPGVTQGCFYGQQERTEEINRRIDYRHYATARPELAPRMDTRPMNTKYSRFPILDFHQTPASAPPLEQNHTFSSYSVDIETALHNQTTALQHGAPQGVYVPNTNSELYRVTLPYIQSDPQPFPDLFTTSIYITNSSVDTSIGKDTFMNHTRTQLRGLNQ